VTRVVVREPAADVPAGGAVVEKARRENFVVASRLLPPRLRRHLLAIYAFARLVDDLGDEYGGDRAAALDALGADVDRIYDGEPPRHEAIADLPDTIREFGIPREPFDRLIQANRQDQAVAEYATWDELLGYCELSANPVGRLVLHVLRRATPDRVELSDRICTALQLVEHWQDVGEDRRRGRVYLPLEDRVEHGVSDDDLTGATTPEGLRALVRFEARRARRLLDEGAPLVRTLSGFGRLAVAGYVGGGYATLDAIERAGGAVLPAGPRATTLEKLRATWKVLRAGR
jgi:squalene synthase HpnC